jgi:non-ribosomal peptide synthetase component F
MNPDVKQQSTIIKIQVAETDTVQEFLLGASRAASTFSKEYQGMANLPGTTILLPKLRTVLHATGTIPARLTGEDFHLFPVILDNDALEIAALSPSTTKLAAGAMIKQYFTVLSSLSTAILDGQLSTNLENLSLKSEAEETALRESARPGRRYEDLPVGSIHQKFRQQARISPLLPALRCDRHGEYTYSQVDKISDQIAAQLRRKMATLSEIPLLETHGQFKSVSVVAMCTNRSVELIMLVLASWKAGLAIVYVDPTSPPKRNKLILETVLCRLMIVENDDITYLPAEKMYLSGFDFSKSPRQGIEVLSNPGEVDLMQDYENLMVVRFTSGSTGSPKGVMEGHNTAAPFIVSWGSKFKRNSLLFLNPTFTFAESAVWPYLISGGCVTVVNPRMLEDLPLCISRYNATDLFITPSALQIMQPADVPNLSYLVMAGEPVPKNIIATWAPHVELCITFGASEVGSPAFRSYQEM